MAASATLKRAFLDVTCFRSTGVLSTMGPFCGSPSPERHPHCSEPIERADPGVRWLRRPRHPQARPTSPPTPWGITPRHDQRHPAPEQRHSLCLTACRRTPALAVKSEDPGRAADSRPSGSAPSSTRCPAFALTLAPLASLTAGAGGDCQHSPIEVGPSGTAPASSWAAESPFG